MDAFWTVIGGINGMLFSEFTIYALLISGVTFTIWSGFGQYYALTHGTAVVRGKYDSHDDPGAISHFQALSTALSATVGLGNIGGVAVAVALGGPGAVFWMWIIGMLGMALKMTEVTQSMLYRDVSDPENPHGGPMYVVREGLKKRFMPLLVKLSPSQGEAVTGEEKSYNVSIGLGPIGSLIGGIFVVTLIISAITGGNMFQAWIVADLSQNYFGIPSIATGIILCVVVGAVIIGGIKRIGKAAGLIVPIMCAIYFLAALFVILSNASQIPDVFSLIVVSGLPEFMGGQPASASGAFIGASMGFAMMWGVKRALFSSEAGQGSAPIAHAAAKSDEPVREGIVSGLEPFIDTIVVCTMTALVILVTGAWDRAPEAETYIQKSSSVQTVVDPKTGDVIEKKKVRQDPPKVIQAVDLENKPLQKLDENGKVTKSWTLGVKNFVKDEKTKKTTGVVFETDLSNRSPEAKEIASVNSVSGWKKGLSVFTILEVKGVDPNTNSNKLRLDGTVVGDEKAGYKVQWNTVSSKSKPKPSLQEDKSVGVYANYASASLTAHAFDRAAPGLGKWLVSIAAWLFALSTMISWSYYGEKGIVYLFGDKGVLPYKVIYCLLIIVSCLGFITTDAQLDAITTLGLGVMLVANIPIMWIFASESMKAYHAYIKELKAGKFNKNG